MDERSPVNTQQLLSEHNHDRTGSHTPQRVIPLVRSSPTSAPVGTHKRLNPTDLGSYHENNGISSLQGVRENTYKLYPSADIVTGVPLGTGNSVYTFPEVPTIGFVRGRTSSSIGVRTISRAMGWTLKVSYAIIQ